MLGIAAAVGLVLFFVGALVAHVRSKVFFTIAFLAAFEAFAIASLVSGSPADSGQPETVDMHRTSDGDEPVARRRRCQHK